MTFEPPGTGNRRVDIDAFVCDGYVEVPDGFATDGSDPSPVARAIVSGLARAG